VLVCITALAQERQVRLALLVLAALLAAFLLAVRSFQQQEAGHLLLCLGLLVLVALLPLCRQQKIPQIYLVRHSHLWQKLFKLVEILEQSRLQ
jgi:hypothetical protein